MAKTENIDELLRLSTILLEEYNELHGKTKESLLEEQLKPKSEEAHEPNDTPGQKQIKENELPENERLEIIFKAIHDLPAEGKQSALCLSGGGIRSATFCLGVIQGLARHNLLDKFHYLSTVSGGGYIGGWLTAWISRERSAAVVFKVLKDDINDSPNKSKTVPEPKQITHLRAYSNLLTPKIGLLSIDTWTLVAIYLRNLFLNWLVLVPLILAVLLIPRIYAALINKKFGIVLLNVDTYEISPYFMGLGLILGAIALAYISSHRPSIRNVKDKNVNKEQNNITQNSSQNINENSGKQGSEVSNKKDNDIKKKDTDETNNFVMFFFIPLLAAVFLLTVGRAWRINPDNDKFWSSLYFAFGGAGLMFLAWFFTFLAVRLCFKPVSSEFRRDIKTRFYELLVVLITGFLAGLCLWLLSVPGKLLKVLPLGNPDFLQQYAWLDGPLLMLVFLFMGILSNGLGSWSINDDDREWWARAAAYILLATVIWTAVNALVIWIPKNLPFDHNSLLNIPLGLSGLIAGFVTILFAISSKTPANDRQAEKAGRLTTVLDYGVKFAAPIFTGFLVIFLSFLTDFLIILINYLPKIYNTSVKDWKLPFEDWSKSPNLEYKELIAAIHSDTSFLFLACMFIGLLFISFIMAMCININQFSLHSLYRNRLIRTYLGASRKRKPNSFTDFDQDDDVIMSDIRTGNEGSRIIKPFHIVNMTWNLVNGKKLEWQNRMATTFTVSPLHSGNYQSGYRRSGKYGGEDSKSESSNKNSKPISLGTALTISGAAASPNMGYYSSTFVTFLMTLFNARLGWWLGNPEHKHSYKMSGPRWALGPMIDEALGRTGEDKKYIYLSDGGHFENLGLYEMVLRRCHYIFVVDASRDPDHKFENLGNAIRRIRVDLGVNIEIVDYPKKQDKPSPYCAIGNILYSKIDGEKEGNEVKDENKAKDRNEVKYKKDEKDGILIYIKPNLIGDEPTDIFNYAQVNLQFPHEPTTDLWFSEQQFESYRELGLHAINQIFKKPLKSQDFSDLRSKVEDYLREAQNIR